MSKKYVISAGIGYMTWLLYHKSLDEHRMLSIEYNKKLKSRMEKINDQRKKDEILALRDKISRLDANVPDNEKTNLRCFEINN